MAPALPNFTTFAPAGTLKSELALLPEAASDEAAPELAALEEALPPQPVRMDITIVKAMPSATSFFM